MRPGTSRGTAHVEHKPGMADEMMPELALLLAEDGVDLSGDDLPDMQTLQAALNRAVERRNFELFSPVGVTRQIAVDTSNESSPLSWPATAPPLAACLSGCSPRRQTTASLPFTAASAS